MLSQARTLQRLFGACLFVCATEICAQPIADPYATVTGPSPEAMEAARLLFREGADLAAQGRWEQARDRFRRALAVRTSPLLHYNLAVASQNSGHFVEAVDQYRQFLREDSDPSNVLRRRDAQSAISAMEPILARVVINATLTASESIVRLAIDGRPLPTALLGAEIPVDPTSHTFEVERNDGMRATATVTLGEGAVERVQLVWRQSASVPNNLDAAVVVDDASVATVNDAETETPGPYDITPGSETSASPGLIERVRRAIEARAAAVDIYGQRRWQRTVVLYAFQGTGNPVGIGGIGLRWAARPWFDFEFTTGYGHPFGYGIGLAFAVRYPWSYRYGIGLLLGVSTNITTLSGSMPSMNFPGPCQGESPFTPMWLLIAVTHEWRVSMGMAFRLSLGARALMNSFQLNQTLLQHCTAPRQDIEPLELAFDRPDLDHQRWWVLPWINFDVGYAF